MSRPCSIQAGRCRPLGFAVTESQVSDYKTKDALVALPVPNPKAMLADRGYDSDNFLQDLLIYGTLSVMPSRKDQSVSQKTDWRHDRDRDSVRHELPQCRSRQVLG